MILLDTHALIWWVSDSGRIPARARRLIDTAVAAAEVVAISSISLWEVAMLVSAGRLTLTMELDAWIGQVESLPFLTFLPVDNRVAVRSVMLSGFAHRDPADRIIAATALGSGATLVTADARLRGYAALKTVWD